MRVRIALGTLVILFAVSSVARAGDGRMLEGVRTVPLEGTAARWATLVGKYVVYQPNEHDLLAIDIGTGLVRWKYAAGPTPIRQILRRDDDRLIVIAADLQIVSLKDGSVEWTYPLGCKPSGACQITPESADTRRVVLSGFNEARDSIMTLDLVSREERWPSWVKVGPIGHVDADEKMIIVSDPSGKSVTAVDPGVGRVRWTAALPSGAGAAGTPPRRMWAGEDAVYVFRAVANGLGPSRIDTLAASDGALVRTARGVVCSGDLSRCGVEPGDGCAITYEVAGCDSERPGQFTIHDLVSGRTVVDEQAFLSGPPIVLAGRLAVVSQRNGDDVVITGRWLPTGAIAWTRMLPGGQDVRMAVGSGSVYSVQCKDGVVLGLSLRDGGVTAFGVVELGGERVERLFPTSDGVLVTTSRRLIALRQRPIADILEQLRAALVAGDVERAEEIDGVIVQLARHLPEAADAHGVFLRYALLRAAADLARGDGAAAIDRAATLIARTPSGTRTPVLVSSEAINNLLSDWLLAPGARHDGALARALGQLAGAWAGRVEALGAELTGADDKAREIVKTTGLQLVEALGRAEQIDVAWRLLRLLAAPPLSLDASSLPSPARRVVALQASGIARRAGAAVRARHLTAAVELLGAALDLPFAASVIGARDASRLQIEVYVSGDERPRKSELAALCAEAAEGWRAAATALEPTGDIECYEACQRRRLTCVRPCVSKAACEDANLTCVDACDSEATPRWPRPAASAKPTDPAFLKCL